MRTLCSSCAPVDQWWSSGRSGSRAGAEVHHGRGGGLELRLELGQRPSAGLAATDPSSCLFAARLPYVLSRPAVEACVDHGWGMGGRLASPLLRLDGPHATAATVARRGGPQWERTRRPRPLPPLPGSTAVGTAHVEPVGARAPRFPVSTRVLHI
jgi:hypothetical protein